MRKGKILLIEDDAETRKIIELLLALDFPKPDYEVFWAPDGQKGGAIARRLGADLALVISDVRMEHIDGIDFILRLREQTNATVPAILMSGYDLVQIKEDHPGFSEARYNVSFFPKPIIPDELVALVRKKLEE